MADQPSDTDLRQKGLALLQEQLGAEEALRFLALISREPFDYQAWRKREFEGMSLGEVLAGINPEKT